MRMLSGGVSSADRSRDTALVSSLDLRSNSNDHVLSVVVKDCIDIQGTVSGCGSAAFADNAPAQAHADVVQHLLESGCAITGKAKMHELAFGMTGINAFTGTPVNPSWPDIIPGGSSSGSAVAVAAGLCDFSVGTDTGGSVRQPAICCGIYGIKPTFGRISRAGCHPARSSLDCVGVFARTAPMLTRGMQAIDPSFIPAVLATAPKFARIKTTLDKTVGDYLIYGLMEGVPLVDYVLLEHLDAAFDAGMTVIGAETAQAFGHLIDQDAPLGDDIKTRLAAARSITAEDIARAEAVRTKFTAAVDSILETADVLITPALPMVPPRVQDAHNPQAVLPLTRFLRPFNLSGHPAIVLPCDPASGMPPMGVQIVGRKGDDAYLCAVAEWMAHTISVFRKEDPVQ
jgi:amidase